MKALLVFLLLPLCGCVLQAKYDESQKRIDELTAELKQSEKDMHASENSLKECRAHKYQMFSSGFRTWRLDTVTGNSCIALTSEADWKTKRTKAQSCDCTDLFEDPSNPPGPALTKLYCGF